MKPVIEIRAHHLDFFGKFQGLTHTFPFINHFEYFGYPHATIRGLATFLIVRAIETERVSVRLVAHRDLYCRRICHLRSTCSEPHPQALDKNKAEELSRLGIILGRVYPPQIINELLKTSSTRK